MVVVRSYDRPLNQGILYIEKTSVACPRMITASLEIRELASRWRHCQHNLLIDGESIKRKKDST